MVMSGASIVVTSLLADSLSLGGHWVYDQAVIAEQLGEQVGHYAPLSRYNPGKVAGDQTHYGDQTLILLESIAAVGAFDSEDFARRWRAFWEDGETVSYRDGATRATLANLREGTALAAAGSGSSDIAGAARMAPLFLLEWESVDTLAAAARAQTALTHANPEVVEAADFFARWTWRVRAGEPTAEALAAVAAEPHWSPLAQEWVAAARRTAREATLTDTAAAVEHGLSCAVDGAFPLVCHILLRYADDPKAGLAANQLAGGDTAARALLMGLIYGARPELSNFPEPWLADWRARERVEAALQSFGAHPRRAGQ